MNDELLIRFIEKQCSTEEARKVLLWIEAEEKNKNHFRQLQSICASIDINFASLHEKANPEAVQSIINQVHEKRSRYITYITAIAGIASAVLLFLMIPSGKEEVNDYEKALAQANKQNEITLTIQDNKQIALTDSSVVVAYNKKGKILVNDTVTITKITERKNTLNTIHVPYGKRSILILSDGSKVHLNSGSSLVYPTEFTADKREVYLEGEAFFEVSKEADHKFIVRTAYKSVEVLGTQFNVSIDKASNKFETVLVTGSIALENNTGKIELVPNQYYGYTSDSGEEVLKTVDVNNYISWINGKLKFTREPLFKVIDKIEKSYNIEIKMLDSTYLHYEISGNLNLKSTAEETLNVLTSILLPNNKSQNQQLYQIQKKE